MAKAGETLRGRWELVERLGAGSFGETWIARDGRSGELAVAKLLDLRRAADWKAVELFEREARVLRNLAHDSIPSYLDAFEDDGQHVLVQRLAHGRSLESWVQEGWRPTDEEVRQIAEQLLDVLVYLHRLNPPVVHRDIKPANIIWDREQVRLSLVDFGAVKLHQGGGAGSSTVVGTFGYMAPEQFRGKAEPATDLYALGATLLFLMTHLDPSDLPMRGLGIDVSEALGGRRDGLTEWLERLVEPDIIDRFQRADHARERLASASPEEPSIMPIKEPPQITFAPKLEQQEEPDWRALLPRHEMDEAALARHTRLSTPLGFIIWGALWLGSLVLAMWAPGASSNWAGLGAFLGLIFGLGWLVSGYEQREGKPPLALLWERKIGWVVGIAWYFGAMFSLGWVLATENIAAQVFMALGAFCGLVMFYTEGGQWRHIHNQVALEERLGAELPLAKDALLLVEVIRWEPGQALELRSRQQFGVNALWSLSLAALMVGLGYSLSSGVAELGLIGCSGLGVIAGALYAGIKAATRPTLRCAPGIIDAPRHGVMSVADAQEVQVELVCTNPEQAKGGEEGGTTPTFEIQLKVRGHVVWSVAESHEVAGQALAEQLDRAIKSACFGEGVVLDHEARVEAQADEPAFWKGQRGW